MRPQIQKRRPYFKTHRRQMCIHNYKSWRAKILPVSSHFDFYLAFIVIFWPFFRHKALEKESFFLMQFWVKTLLFGLSVGKKDHAGLLLRIFFDTTNNRFLYFGSSSKRPCSFMKSRKKKRVMVCIAGPSFSFLRNMLHNGKIWLSSFSSCAKSSKHHPGTNPKLVLRHLHVAGHGRVHSADGLHRLVNFDVDGPHIYWGPSSPSPSSTILFRGSRINNRTNRSSNSIVGGSIGCFHFEFQCSSGLDDTLDGPDAKPKWWAFFASKPTSCQRVAKSG